jgi:hypothetical protein
MTTPLLSGTTSFTLNLNELVEEAFERCGAELRSGYELKTARRSINLMLSEWANRGVNLWTLDTGVIPLVAGTATYNLPIDTVDLLDHVTRTGSGVNQNDININRISSSTYLAIPNKNATGRPIEVWIDRQSGATGATGTIAYPTITVWPVPSTGSSYSFVYTRLRRLQDAGTGINGQDVPFRMMPAFVAGLAYYLSLKLPGVDPGRRMELKAMYEEDWQRAADEDREKAPIRFVPRETFLR